MKEIPVIDITIIIVYMMAMIGTGIFFHKKNKNIDRFTKASGKIPQWAVGLSLYATFLSSNTFLGVPGKAFGSNWNSLVFSMSMPVSAWIATKYFIPFYRNSGTISAYTHLEQRFGSWARTYAVVCFLLTQIARMGSVFFGIAITLQALTGYSMLSVMILMGSVIIIYTLLGGMEAVIWTEVLQALIKTAGALIILFFILFKMPGGIHQIIAIGKADHKFSLGSFEPDFTAPTFWVIFLYGIFINLTNFGIDQNYVQRYHATASPKEASGSVWLCVKLYAPVSLLFFMIGTALYAWYQQHPEMLAFIKIRAAADRMPVNTPADELSKIAAGLRPQDYGDKVLPDFMKNILPVGVLGLVVAAILSAAMSTISSGLNACATVFTIDIYKRHFNKHQNPGQTFHTLLLSTMITGLVALGAGIAMIGVKSILDIWWNLSGIFAAGMLGLFLLGMLSRSTGNGEALLATMLGLLVIAWLSLSGMLPDQYSILKNALHTDMTIVVGTLVIFLSGILFSRRKKRTSAGANAPY